MNREFFSVFDSVAQRYLRPFTAESCAEAVRGFATICNDPEHMFYQHSTDYTLFHIGYFDYETGTIESLHEPHNLGLAAQMIHGPEMSLGEVS